MDFQKYRKKYIFVKVRSFKMVEKRWIKKNDTSRYLHCFLNKTHNFLKMFYPEPDLESVIYLPRLIIVGTMERQDACVNQRWIAPESRELLLETSKPRFQLISHKIFVT